MDDSIAFGASGAVQIFAWILGLAALGVNIFLIVDTARRPDWAFTQAGTTKVLWIVLGAVGGIIGCCCWGLPGFIAPAVWFAAFRSKVEAAEQGGGPQTFGGPPGGGYPPPPGGGFPPPPGGTPPPGGGGFPPPGGTPPPGGYQPPPPGGFPPPPPAQ